MSLAVEQLELGPLGTNCYLVCAERGSAEAVVVDPSGDAAIIRARLDSMGARCAAILVTHGHFDHILGVADLAEATGARVYAPAGELALLEQPEQFTPPGLSVRAVTPDILLSGGEKIDVAGIAFAVLPVPGHSPAHLAYAANGHVFSGDVLFAGSVGRTDFPGSDWDTLLGSIRTLLAACDPNTVVCPGHGPTTTLAAELERNPFLVDLRAGSRAE